ncbi:MAG: PEFG-CTERM sorting domain-containing protein [Candidatus Nitrosomaritimum aestuariumsis]|jgi:predicted secreted protein with PEFG-CTERM motif|nr:PEFG-CTERM sorting domain-containing protein [Nitrosopumilaceae archaeon]
MKTITIGSFFVLFAIASGMVTSPAFADHATASVSTPQGTSVPGCEATNECYIPYEVTVDVGGVVTWTNDDSAAHTVTGGSAADGPSGVFDSGLFMAGTTFEHKFEATGEFPYFCMVHPWMEGIVVVQEAGAEEDDSMMEGELMVTVMDSAVKGGTQIDLEFSELHVNYEITATQNGEVVLQETAHAMEMTASHMVDAVGSDEDPIDVEIVSLGIGAPGEEDSWTGPVGTVATAKVVPEFGTIAMMILAVAIISIVAVTAKSRVIPRL